jgi:hypothetical protein
MYSSVCRVLWVGVCFEGHRAKPLTGLNRRAPKVTVFQVVFNKN